MVTVSNVRMSTISTSLTTGSTSERDYIFSNNPDVGSIFYNTDTSNVEIYHQDPSNNAAWRDLVVNNRNGIDISGGEEYFRMFDRREQDVTYSQDTTIGYRFHNSSPAWIETITKGSGSFGEHGYTVQSNGMFLLHASLRSRGSGSHATHDFYVIPSGTQSTSHDNNYYIDREAHTNKFSSSPSFTLLKLVPSDYHYYEIQTLIELNAGDIVSVRRSSGNKTSIRGIIFTVLKLR
ncbi:MAG: hypothetical protein CMD14_09180 [Flavobacteriales bacterium]|nr:hypothetical protein [Flavobacteriales bacterium]|tara:strand:+ start:27122 stop:27826 length:705 start_codon:yes stop_codon:yes gene_type:complete